MHKRWLVLLLVLFLPVSVSAYSLYCIDMGLPGGIVCFNQTSITGFHQEWTDLNNIPVYVLDYRGNISLLQSRLDQNSSVFAGNITSLSSRISAVNSSAGGVTNLNASILAQGYANWTQLDAVNASIQINTWNSSDEMRTALAGNLTKLQNDVNSRGNANMSDVNGKASPGVCGTGYAVQNTTTSGVQCVLMGASSGNASTIGFDDLNRSILAQIDANSTILTGYIDAVNASSVPDSAIIRTLGPLFINGLGSSAIANHGFNLSMTQANGTVGGWLSAMDWLKFNNSGNASLVDIGNLNASILAQGYANYSQLNSLILSYAFANYSQLSSYATIVLLNQNSTALITYINAQNTSQATPIALALANNATLVSLIQANSTALNERIDAVNSSYQAQGYANQSFLVSYYYNQTTSDSRYLSARLRLYFWNNTVTLYGKTYTVMNTTSSPTLLSTPTFATLANGEYNLANRTYIINISSIPAGAYSQHTSVNYSTGGTNKILRIHSELYIVNSTGDERLIGTSVPSDPLVVGLWQDVDFSGTVSTKQTINSGEYLVMKLNATISGSGSPDPTFTVLTGGSTGASLTIGVDPSDIIVNLNESDPIAVPRITAVNASVAIALANNASLLGALNQNSTALITYVNAQNTSQSTAIALALANNATVTGALNQNSTALITYINAQNTSQATPIALALANNATLVSLIQANDTRTQANIDSRGTVNGSGTLNYVPLWTPDGGTLGNSVIQQYTNGTVFINANTSTTGDLYAAGDLLLGGDILNVMGQNVTGNILPGSDTQFTLGSSSNRWLATYSFLFWGSLDWTNLTNIPAYVKDWQPIINANSTTFAGWINAVNGSLSNYAPESQLMSNSTAFAGWIGAVNASSVLALANNATVTGALNQNSTALITYINAQNTSQATPIALALANNATLVSLIQANSTALNGRITAVNSSLSSYAPETQLMSNSTVFATNNVTIGAGLTVLRADNTSQGVGLALALANNASLLGALNQNSTTLITYVNAQNTSQSTAIALALANNATVTGALNQNSTALIAYTNALNASILGKNYLTNGTIANFTKLYVGMTAVNGNINVSVTTGAAYTCILGTNTSCYLAENATCRILYSPNGSSSLGACN